MNQDKKIMEIILKKSEDLLNLTVRFFIERCKAAILAEMESSDDDKPAFQVMEPYANYESPDYNPPSNAYEAIDRFSGLLDLDNMMAIDKMKEDLIEMGIIKRPPKKPQENITIYGE